MDMEAAYSEAEKLDEQAELFAYRSKFVTGDERLNYLDGNSLGKLPAESREIIPGQLTLSGVRD